MASSLAAIYCHLITSQVGDAALVLVIRAWQGGSMRFVQLSRAVIVSLCCALGCGGLDEDQGAVHQEPSSASSGTIASERVTITASCLARCEGGGSVSCSGSSCMAVDGQYVVCDGTYTYCPCKAVFVCESGPTLSCGDTLCSVLGPLDNKVCGGVQCNGSAPEYCPPLPGDLECF